MPADHVVINPDHRAPKGCGGLPLSDGSAHSEYEIASAFVNRFGHEYRYVSPWHHWIKWDGKQRVQGCTGSTFALILKPLHQAVSCTENELRTATAAPRRRRNYLHAAGDRRAVLT